MLDSAGYVKLVSHGNHVYVCIHALIICNLVLYLFLVNVENLARCCNAYVGISHPMESTIAALLGSGPHAMTPLVL